jgi:hypothetical protein
MSSIRSTRKHVFRPEDRSKSGVGGAAIGEFADTSRAFLAATLLAAR